MISPITLWLVACATPVEDTVSQAARLADAIAEGRVPHEVLAAEGLDAAAFEALLFEIAADPQRSRRYREVRSR